MKASTNKEKIKEILTRGVEEVYPKPDALEKALKSGKRLRLYVGIDPTSELLHIGHAIALRKLRQFQDLGHEVILLIGSFTGMIGDPTDKSATRTKLTQKEVLENAATYKKQASKIISFTGRNAAKIMFNHKWLGKMNLADVVELASNFTVQQMGERDMFERRMKEGKPVYLHEFLYPLMQGYDSVAMDVDLEIGGSDQMFNMLAGRTLMRAMKDKEKMVMTLKLLATSEGKKMSKTESGFIALSDPPEQMYGKIMAMADDMILSYFELATEVPMEEIEGMRLALKKGMNPRDVKARLAQTVVVANHGEKAAEVASAHFDTVFRQHDAPEDIIEFNLEKSQNIVEVLVNTKLALSKSEARRLLAQKAIKLDGVVVTGQDINVDGSAEGTILQRGKRQFVRLVR
ncbi:MAG: tyrosine--tRNA ligase [Candidatus Uhrbacteria bacterium]|nr:tyrosine--tRNA ligase [Candidatus Uhrbacteria bacterium]